MVIRPVEEDKDEVKPREDVGGEAQILRDGLRLRIVSGDGIGGGEDGGPRRERETIPAFATLIVCCSIASSSA